MTPLVLALEDPNGFAAVIAQAIEGDTGAIETRRFPDGESYVRLLADPNGRDVVLVAALDRPDPKLASLLFAAETVRELGARRVLLAAPYLPYLRQDKAFRPGESVSALHFARLLSRSFDGIATVDPHLHRIAVLADIFKVPALAVSAASAMAAWIAAHVEAPLVVGPDSESLQWASRIAGLAGCPYVVLEKTRHGDRDVAISGAGLSQAAGRTPVLIDDIVSTAGTMIGAVRRLREANARPAVCVAVHGLFAGDAFERLQAAGAAQIVTTNTVAHISNAIDVRPVLGEALRDLLCGSAD